MIQSGVILGFELIYGRQLPLSPAAAFHHSHVQSCHHGMTVGVVKTHEDLQRRRRAICECVKNMFTGFFFCGGLWGWYAHAQDVTVGWRLRC